MMHQATMSCATGGEDGDKPGGDRGGSLGKEQFLEVHSFYFQIGRPGMTFTALMRKKSDVVGRHFAISRFISRLSGESAWADAFCHVAILCHLTCVRQNCNSVRLPASRADDRKAPAQMTSYLVPLSGRQASQSAQP
jgi:hypothetical protein